MVTSYQQPKPKKFGPEISEEMKRARQEARRVERLRLEEEKRERNRQLLLRVEEEERQKLREERARIVAENQARTHRDVGFEEATAEIQRIEPPAAAPDPQNQRPRVDRNRYNIQERELSRREHEDKHRYRHEYTFTSMPQNSRNKPFERRPEPLQLTATAGGNMDLDTPRDRNSDRDRERLTTGSVDTYRPNNYQGRRGVDTTVNGGTSLPRFHVQPTEAKPGDSWIFNLVCTCGRCRDEKNELVKRGYEDKKREEEMFRLWKEQMKREKELLEQRVLQQSFPQQPVQQAQVQTPMVTDHTGYYDQGNTYGYQNMGGGGHYEGYNNYGQQYTGYNNHGQQQTAYQQQWQPQQMPVVTQQQAQVPPKKTRNMRRSTVLSLPFQLKLPV